MLVVLYCIGLLFLGYASFCFPIGIMVFRTFCVRSVYEKKSFVDSASHVKDEKIMKPLLKAKKRWIEKHLEKVSIKVSLKPRLSFSFSRNKLFADLWLHPAFSKNKKIVLLVHGFTDSASGMAYLAEAYYEKKISVLAVNLRGHGDSEGEFSGLGYIHTDARDIIHWINFITGRFGVEVNIILHGVSMGASSVIQAAYGFKVPVKLVVADCSSSECSNNVKMYIQRFFPKNAFSSFLIWGIYCSASIANYTKNGFFFGKNSTKKILQKSSKTTTQIPLLIFHGEDDTLVSFHNAQDIFAAAHEPKKIILVKGAPHIGSFFYDKKKYMESVFFYLQD